MTTYVLMEYLTYLVGIAVLAAILFGASALFLFTEAKAPRIKEASRHAVSSAVQAANTKLIPMTVANLKLLPVRFRLFAHKSE